MKLFILLVIIGLLATTAFIYALRKTIGASGGLALACAIVLSILIAPVYMAHTLCGVLLVSVFFVAFAG